MENRNLKRTIIFEKTGKDRDLVRDYQLAYCNWGLRYRIHFVID